MSFLSFLAGCAGQDHYVKTPKHPTKRLIILPEGGGSRPLKPYVVNGERYYPLPRSEGFVQVGLASWYGGKFHGRLTAKGEVFNMYKKSAAHKTLPLGTYVKVLNLSNNKVTIVRINDRGPFVKGRIIDLSYAAAKDIALVGPGLAKVRIEALAREVDRIKSPVGIRPVVEIRDLDRGEFTVQVGAFKDKANALKLVDRLRIVFDHVEVRIGKAKDIGSVYRVMVSRAKTLTKAAEVEKKLEGMGFEQAFIVSL
jgi:rare lipoprotein A